MLPLQQAREVRDSVIEYIKATYRFKEEKVSSAFYSFIEDKENGLFKGPYVSLRTPFVSATEDESKNIPLEIIPSFPPYKHQLQAFRQLSMLNGHKPEPTLLTTGTGSGKTECFLYPILDYCYHCNQYEHQKGVKVIIMYPMNALASDQAKRLAETIWNDDKLKGKITAGLFIGEGSNHKYYNSTMGPDHIIEDRNAILDTVPDILLTNFKMLDYGLMRQEFMSLWKGNIDTEQKALRFIVLDELHTYDGAQGTDVANLIRRLKLKLNLPKEHLCPVGTSATIGNTDDNKTRLCEYASNIFGVTFKEENVIEEHRIPVDEYIKPQNTQLPSGDIINDCVFSASDTVETYMRHICEVWLKNGNATPVEAGESLRKMSIVADMLKALEGGILSLDELQFQMEDNKEFRRLSHQYSEKTCLTAIENLLALVAYAKQQLPNGRMVPMLYLQVQLWQRELSGILRYVQNEPLFSWRGSLKKDDDKVALPIYFCRNCGASGWLSHFHDTDKHFSSNVKKINSAFATNEKEIILLNTDEEEHEPVEEYNEETNKTYEVKIKDLYIKKDSNDTDDATIRLRACRKLNEKLTFFSRTCPECNTKNTICQIGGRTSTLSSVAISQILSSDFDKADISDRKLLIFTNSVQDAAHHAGFYEARTFRFLFRQSMQKFINTLSAPVNLVQLQQGFRNYWHQQLSEEEYFNRFFPADLATRIDLSRDYRDGQGFTSRFKEEFEHRVDWEITSEFGLTAQIGRTLEKTGASAAFFKTEQIKQVYALMKPWMEENNMQAEAEDEMTFCHFVYGILQRMRIYGAVDHVFLEKYRKENLTRWALNWERDGRHFLNKKLGGSIHYPYLVGTMFTDKNNNDMLDIAVLRTEGSKSSWYSTYFSKTFPHKEVVNNVYLFNDFMRRLMNAMVEANLLNREPQGGGNYAIRPDAIWVSRKVKHIQCEKCQSRLSVAQEDVFARNTKCLDYKCRGTYDKEIKPELNYYQQVYNRKESPRVHAHEHTGLLDRQDREALERDFKQHPHPNSVNVLVATSTLEMGIDIGDLNVMGNTNVPPKPSNFLQRVGRAGRKEGSALVLNYAHAAEPHDMYYFSYPMEMMQGEISTPGCFLEAKDILRRHFLAFCIDSWTSANANNTLPSKIRDLNLTTPDIFSSDAFIINQIISFIKNNKTTLTATFGSQYGPQTKEPLTKLFNTLSDGTFYNHIISCFATLQEKFYALNEERDQYREEKKRKQNNDPQMGQIDSLIKSTNKQYAQLMDQLLIEYMTNAGLLPNYAFPETGIKLEANVQAYHEKNDSKDIKTEPKAIELMRPASQGIKELAPGNYFYTQKQKLLINGISTFDWKDSLTEMQFCSKCDCLALKGEDGFSNVECPKCGDLSWGVNFHTILKFTTAKSVMRSNETALDDSSDERDNEKYILKRHYMFSHNSATTSYAMKNIGFGIEFCNNMNLYELNYGMSEQKGEKIEVNNDTSAHEYGFIVCRHCGKATHLLSQTENKSEKQHYPFCTHHDRTFEDDAKGEVFERLFLYRHLQTEAIKILLPVQIMDAASSVEMFKAGIELGMKTYYKSSPDHIRIDSYDEMNRATNKKDHYLVMYDTIPGGTGYLSKLYNTEEFSNMLELAYNKIADCECQHEGKDGCYHCIMTYGNQYNREFFSREQAENLFAELVSHRKTWEQLDGSVGTVSTSGGAEDSELELKFVNALKTISKQNNWTLEKLNDTDTYHYELQITESEINITYHVIPQFALSGTYGVRHYTVADFLFIPMAATIDGVEKQTDQLPMWAVYLDGYAYHAQSPDPRFYGDKEKRDDIRASKTHLFYTWTLTWDDMQLFEEGHDNELENNNVTRLIDFLRYPQIGYIRETVFGCIADNEPFMPHGANLYHGEISINRSAYDTLTDDLTDEQVAEALKDSVSYDWHLQQTSSIDKDEWVNFWRRYNLLQFFPQDNHPQNIVHQEEIVIDRDAIKAIYPGLEDIVDQLLDNGINFSFDGDVELHDDEDTVIAEAGMLLLEQKIAIDPLPGTEEVFHNHGFTTISSSEFNIELVINR